MMPTISLELTTPGRNRIQLHLPFECLKLRVFRGLKWIVNTLRGILQGLLALILTTTGALATDEVIQCRGETIYVPIYSSIHYQDNKRTIELAATLSIHNVDPEASLTLVAADYYNTEGTRIRRYFDKPISLRPLETKNIVVEKTDTSGGTGANFLVEWKSDKPMLRPLVEAVMVSVTMNQGVSFTSQGRVIKRTE